MTDASKFVFENFHIRKSKKQKDGFIDYICKFAEDQGYAAKVEKASFGARNIVIGNPDSAKAVYTAHYDTCPRLPFPNFITPKNFFIYLAYQLLITVALLAVLFGAAFVAGILSGTILGLLQVHQDVVDAVAGIIPLVAYFIVLFLIMNGPANKHTANDNTSGVITLIEIMQALPEDKRNEIAFVFFDLEEMGLFGSSGFASKHKKAMKDKLLLNFDCVSDGSTILFAVKNSAKKYIPALEKSFIPCEKFAVDIASKGVFYPSDQANFKAGVGVAALNYSKKLRTLYMDKIHTDKDRVFDEENIEFLTAGAVRLREEL